MSFDTGLLFNDELISSQNLHPLFLNPPYNLTLTIDELITPKEMKEPRESRRRRDQRIENDVNNNNQIPRPHNAFIIFRTDYAAKIKNDDKRISIRIISRMASRQWNLEPELVKAFFKLLADMYQQRHKILFPNYKYAPKNKPSPCESKKKNRSTRGKQKSHQIITWYLYDDVEDSEPKNTDPCDWNNFAQMSLEDRPQQNNTQVDVQQPTPVSTFINYTASPSTSYPSLSNTNPNPTYRCYDDLIINNDNNPLIPSSGLNPPPSDNNILYWPESHNNINTEPSFEYHLYEFAENYFH
jgi:hypothetical protein